MSGPPPFSDAAYTRDYYGMSARSYREQHGARRGTKPRAAGNASSEPESEGGKLASYMLSDSPFQCGNEQCDVRRPDFYFDMYRAISSTLYGFRTWCF